MSDNPNGQADPVTEHLRERSRILLDEIADRRARLDEINAILTALADGRSRVNRKRRGAVVETLEAAAARALPEDAGAAGAA